MAQPADMDVYAAIERRRRPSPREVEQLVSSQHVIGPFDKSEKQIEFGSAQIDQGLGRRMQLPSCHIETPASELEHAAGPDCGTGWRHGRAAQNCTNRASSSRVLNGFGR